MNFFARQYHKAINVTKTLLALDENTRRWDALRGSLAGKRVFLIGNGPSLNVTPLYLLQDEITLCFNRFYLLHERIAWRPYFYMCIDPEVLPDITPDINLHAPEYRWLCLHALHSRGVARRDNLLLMHHVVGVPYFSRRLPLFGSGGSVAYAALQTLLFLGASEIYLIGVDQNYVLHTTATKTSGIRIRSEKDDDPNHFDPRYFGAGRRYHQPVHATRERMIRAFTRARDVAEEQGVPIRNAGVGGELEVYPRVSFDSLFEFPAEQRYALLAKGIDPACDPARLMTVIRQEVPRGTIEGDLPDLFTTTTALAAKVTTKLVLEFVPFGPIEEKVLFVRRAVRNDVVRARLSKA